MSAFVDRDYSSAAPGEAPAKSMAVRRRVVTRGAFADAEYAPTTSLTKVFVTLATCLLLSLLVSARGVVHAGTGMPDGLERTTTLAVGNAALWVASAVHLTWPWDQIQAALGRAPQPAVSPLLASGLAGTSTPTPRATPPTLTPRARPAPGAVGGTTPRPAMGGTVPRPAASPSATPRPTPSSTLQPTVVHGVASRPTSAPATATPSPPRATATPAPRHAAGSGMPVGHPTHAVTVPAGALHHPAGRPVATPHHPVTHPARTPHQTSAPSPGYPLRAITAAHPLRLLVTGDSLPGYLGPQLVDAASALGPVDGHVDVHDGTGLTRPDFVDWSVVAHQQVVAYNPDAVVVWIGGNDFQNMTLPNGAFFQAGTPAWTREYQRRVEICMRIWAHGGAHRVYWLSMPPARNASWAHDYAQINVAVQAAAANVHGAEYLDIRGPITDHGRYSDYVSQNGTPVLVRESDGVHVNIAGSEIVAHEVLPVIVREWRLGVQATPAAPVQQARAHPTPVPAALPALFVSAADAPQSPATVFHAQGRLLYCWVRNDALPPGTTSVTFRWAKEQPQHVIDSFAVARSKGTYTGAYDDAVDKDLGPYSCTIVAGQHTVGTARFTVMR